MLNINLKARFRNKAFIVALASAIVLLLQQVGLKQFIPENWMDILNTVLTILILLGAVVDTSTPGISDQNSILLETNNSNKEEVVNTENTTTSINSEVTQNSPENINASSKISVDNPDNIQEIGATVNSTSSVKPQ